MTTLEHVTTRVDRLETGLDEVRAMLAQSRQQSDQEFEQVKQRFALSEQRLDRIERLLDRVAQQSDRTDKQLDRVARQAERTERRLEEVSEKVDRLSVEMQEFKEEMQEFKEEMRESREQSTREQKEFRRELANIAYSFGRMVEDLFAPSIPGVLAQLVGGGCEPTLEGVRARRRFNGRMKEYDVLAMCGDYLLITEVKNHLRTEHVTDFLTTLQEARAFLSDYREKKVIGALATFYVDMSQVRQVERHGVAVLGVVDGLVEALHTKEIPLQTY
jgi:flagellar biosynthesis GTPase FlhF